MWATDNHMPVELEKIVYSRMHIEKSLRVEARHKVTYAAPPHSSQLM
ncbi:MAG: hypothetical protein ACI9W2_004564 [Gammaproteobacteria bacterium]|jgi:hypothetical protein